MKSKTSFFNKTIFLKNVALYWPLWGLYTFILFCSLPFALWMDYRNQMFYGGGTSPDYNTTLVSHLDVTWHIMLIACAAVLFGMAVFSYLYNSKSANMIHALPVNKAELFGTNIISGLAFLIVPQIFNFILAFFICLANGVTKIEYLALWLVMVMVISFIAFSFVTVCAFFTGLFFALPVYVVIVNALSYWAYALMAVVVGTFGYGVSNLGNLSETIVEFFAPLICFVGQVDIVDKYDDAGTFIGIEVFGIPIVLIYFVVAIILYVIAYVTYQKRHIERAGELITVQWLKPIFRWGAGMSGGIFGGVFLYFLADELNIPCGIPGFIFLMLLLGMLSYFAADMFVRKTFKVFRKENWKGCGGFLVVLLLCFGGLYGVAEMYQSYLPEQADIKSAEVILNYDIEIDGKNAGFVLDVHQQILDNIEECERYDQQGIYPEGNQYISIRYYLNNGDTVYRHYCIPRHIEELEALVQTVEDLELQPEIYLSHILCARYDEVTKFGTGWVELPYRRDGNGFEYNNVSLNEEQVALLWKAVIADCEEGNLMKYNLDNMKYATEENFLTASLQMEFMDPSSNNTYVTSSVDSYGNVISYQESFSGAYLSFGEDCKHMIQALIDCGVITSSDEIKWKDTIE